MAVGKPFSSVVRVLYAQVLMTALVASGFLLIGGWKNAVSPSLGGIVAIVPNLYFAGRLYLARHKDAQGIVNAFYKGETVKLLLTAALFAFALQTPSVNFMTLLLGYAAVLSVFWFALLSERV